MAASKKRNGRGKIDAPAKDQNQQGDESSLQELERLIDWLRPIVVEAPREWIEKNIDLTYDVTCAYSGLIDLSLTPYLIPIIDCWADDEVEKITVVGVQQSGKSLSWKLGLVYSMVNCPGPSLVIYPSDEDAEDTNSDSILPLMNGVEKLKRELSRPKTKRKDRYAFTDSVSYYAGAGSPVISKPCKYVVGDEVDFWVANQNQMNNVRNMDKRTRTHDKSKRFLVSSATTKTGMIWIEFTKSSLGYWHLQCLGAKCKRFIPSYDLTRLQWDTTKEGKVIESSMLLICQHCGKKHKERDARRMNGGGRYIFRNESIRRHQGFQWGALASPFIPWRDIAAAQMEAGRNAGRDAQADLDTGFKGLPFSPRKATQQILDVIQEHKAMIPDPDEFVNLFFAADTQNNGWFWIVRGMTKEENTYLIDYGFARTPEELDEIWNKEHLGILCEGGIIDEGGHRSKEIQEFVRERPGLHSYKGDGRATAGMKYKPSQKITRLILANPRLYQAELLYLIYSQSNRDNNYWFIPEDISNDYLDQIAALRANNRVKHGDEYEKWEPVAPDHYFDCEKMLLVLLDYAKEHFKASNWRKKTRFTKKVVKLKRKPKIQFDW